MFNNFKLKTEGELAALTQREQSEYQIEKSRFDCEVESYNRLEMDYKKNPGKWYYSNLNFTTTGYSVFWINGGRILFPMGVDPNLQTRHTRRAGIGSRLEWKVQLCMRDGELQIYKAIPLLELDCRWLAGLWETLRENNNKIANKAENGYYLIRITNIDENAVSKNGNPMIRVSYEVLSGEARGFSGICCFVKNQPQALKNFETLQKSLDFENERPHDKINGVELKRDLVTAHIDFKSNFVTVSNFRKPTNEEKGAWS